MQTRFRIGIFFGGSSREREVSFAGGRTVYDNLDKRLFDAVPIFVDEFGNMVLLNWQFVYRGTIRDFYPPVSHLPVSKNSFQIYSESIAANTSDRKKMLSEIGQNIEPINLSNHIDIAFLAMHGERGEDGNIQGLLEWYGIPYTGSGILPSALGMNKAVQKKWMRHSGFDGPIFATVKFDEWKNSPISFFEKVKNQIGFPVVVKAANQGSSIGVTILKSENKEDFYKAVNNSFFIKKLTKTDWEKSDKVRLIRELSDIRSSLGFPMFINDTLVNHPEEALEHIDQLFVAMEEIELMAVRGEVEVIAEQFIEGREFSCIVVRDNAGKTIALPPTEIVKTGGYFDYKSKYLPGLSRKITPINLPDEQIERIRQECSRLFEYFEFNVYARIDGFYTPDGRILLNDPNTTSGMMPSSFFFHQAAEIGLNPSQFLTFIIRSSIAERLQTVPSFIPKKALLHNLDKRLEDLSSSSQTMEKVAVVMGGYSTERHISVESGRNIFEKLSSSGKYMPVPVFLTGDHDNHLLFKLPINIMLKDNADDIKHKVEHFERAAIIEKIIAEAKDIFEKYTFEKPIFKPEQITYEDLKNEFSTVFIALHGRPGEDGAVQKKLDQYGIAYNGSGVASSETTIDKFITNNILRDNGFLVADAALINKAGWQQNPEKIKNLIQNMGFPLIAKPADEGCSSAVKKLKNIDEFATYCEVTFRENTEISSADKQKLKLDDKEEFPQKDYFLAETFIDKKGAKHFLEITGGMLTKYENGKLSYEVFEPSEALAEGEILSLAEKFLAGEGQNITPARFSADANEQQRISAKVRLELEKVAKCLNVEGYCRIDAFVRIFGDETVEVVIIEINSLPGMTPATCIYHQAAINGYKPFDFIDKILTFGQQRTALQHR
ncbi:MAG: ATP-grasp domain-containing protein [Flavobacteriales bacterium]|nr:ATP-grasp domain-containing protein [Flavobacteriales bacterium]